MIDLELKELLKALAEGQVKLAEGQGRMEGAVAHLATATEALATATEAALTRLAERIDEFGERVTRGFTNGAATDHKLDDAVHALDARVTKLEHKKPSHKKRR